MVYLCMEASQLYILVSGTLVKLWLFDGVLPSFVAVFIPVLLGLALASAPATIIGFTAVCEAPMASCIKACIIANASAIFYLFLIFISKMLA